MIKADYNFKVIQEIYNIDEYFNAIKDKLEKEYEELEKELL
jgi:hypothetical protein